MISGIADSGSTKTDWRFIDEAGNEVARGRTMGFNPYFHDAAFITENVRNGLKEVNLDYSQVTNVYFYGAGCSSEARNTKVADGLKALFKNAEIDIQHDLLGASRAALGKDAGIAGIIGTGSNSCLWDGFDIQENIPSHGYVLGDEGSGAYLGRELLKLYFNQELPPSLKQQFLKTYNPDIEAIIEKVYRQPDPNVYLASYAEFYGNNKDNVILSNIVEDGLKEFFYKRVVKYTDYQNQKLGFVGSIAYYFKDLLEKIAKIHGMTVTRVVQCPIDGLVAYHTEKEYVTVR